MCGLECVLMNVHFTLFSPRRPSVEDLPGDVLTPAADNAWLDKFLPPSGVRAHPVFILAHRDAIPFIPLYDSLHSFV